MSAASSSTVNQTTAAVVRVPPLEPGDKWLDPDALLRLDHARVQETLRQGLGSAEHDEFVKQLSKSVG
jgi:hypothetical protein